MVRTESCPDITLTCGRRHGQLRAWIHGSPCQPEGAGLPRRL